MRHAALPTQRAEKTPDGTPPSITTLPPLKSSKDAPEIASLLERAKRALEMNGVAAELHMLDLKPSDLERLSSTDIAFRHQQLQHSLNPALCRQFPDLPSGFHTTLFTRLDAAKSDIMLALGDTQKRAAIFEQLGYQPTTQPTPATVPDLRLGTLPPAPALTVAQSPTEKGAAGSTQIRPGPLAKLLERWRPRTDAEIQQRLPDQEESEGIPCSTPTTTPTTCPSSRIATVAKVAAASSVALFAGMHEYGQHRNQIRGQIPDELLPAYDAVETVLYGTYRAEKSALEALAKYLDGAPNGSTGRESNQ